MMAHKTGASIEDINKLVTGNLKKILGNRSPEDYCAEHGRVLRYVSGKKRGRKVAPRALRYAVDGKQPPRLDLIAAVAFKEDLQPYQLLFFDFDPRNAPVMVSKEQQQLIEGIQKSAAALSNTGPHPRPG